MRPNDRSIDQKDRSFIETARRGQIVEAAIDTLAELGYAKASFARIAQRARISPGLISYHFRNKQELMEQVVAEVNADMERAIEERAEGAEGHVAVLRAVIEGFVHYCAERPARLVAVGQIEHAEGWGAQEREQSIGDFEQLLRSGQDDGEFRTFSSRLMAATILAALEAVPTELHARPDTDVRTYADELATAFELAVRKVGR
jgi:AcrR family transcriptional regulator